MKPHVVYLITVNRRELPNRYIGSKSNIQIQDGKMIHRKKEYSGSSTVSGYKEILLECGYSVEILASFDNYQEALEAEKSTHVLYDVVASKEFFNKAIATVNSYSDPAFATYKHTEVDKIARLPRNHPQVLAGIWVGVSKGSKQAASANQKRSQSLLGEKNHFFGKKHTEESKQKAATKIGDAHRGKPKSREHCQAQSEAARRRWAKAREDKARREAESL